jgi:hypothetical protein
MTAVTPSHCVICGVALNPFNLFHQCISHPPWPGQPIRGLEEHEVRRIVREEIQKALEEQAAKQVEWKPPL